MVKRKRIRTNNLFFNVYFSVTVLYLEILFRITTVGGLFSIGMLYTVLFSVAYGSLGYFFSTISRNTKINRIVAGVLLVGTTLAYIVQFLIYKQFKQFYDINTMSGGAGDALTSYFAELMSLIFLKGGLFIIALMAVPAAFYFLCQRGGLIPLPSTKRRRILTAIYSLAIYIFAMLFVLMHPALGLVYHEQYNFQTAVSEFGLITGLRLDLQSHIFGSDYSFENPDVPVIPEIITPEGTEGAGATDETTEPVVEYGYNVMDLDFDALNKKASAEQKKLNAYVSSLTPSKQNEFT